LPFRDIFSMIAGDTEEYWSSGEISREQSLRLWENREMILEALLSHGPDLINVLVSGEEILRFDSDSIPGKENLKLLTQMVEQPEIHTSEMRQSQLFEQCLSVLKTAARKKPLLLVLDDLHWADAGSLSLFFHLGKRITNSAMLIIGTFRPAMVAVDREASSPSLEGIVNEFKRVYGDIEIDLRKVRGEENREFVNAYIDSEPNRFEDDFRSALLEHTEGHPLFTVELLRDMRDRGDITQDKDKHWVVSKSLDWGNLPARLEGVIGERISRLDEHIHRMLECASVEGNLFTAQVIAQLMKIDEYQVIRTLSRELEKRYNLVQEVNVFEINGRMISRFKFSHILFQTYLYNKLSVSERRLLHEHTASILENLFEGHLEDIARSLVVHYDKVGNTDKTIRYLQMAGERALQQFAYQEVIDLIGRSLSLMPDSDADSSPEVISQKARAHISLGQAFQGLGLYTESKEHLNLALKLLDRPIPESAGNLIIGIAQQIVRQVMHRLLPRLFLDQYPEGIQREILLDSARAYSLIGEIYFIGNETLPTIYTVLRTVNLAEGAGPSQKLAEAYAQMCLGTGLVPLHRFARWYRGKAEEVAGVINQPSTRVRVAIINSIYDIGVGNWADVASKLENAMRISEEIGDRRQWEECVANLANNALFMGNVQQSKELFETLVHEARRSNNMLHLVWGLEGLANHKLRSGETDEAAELLNEALRSFPEDVDQITKFEVYGLLARALLRKGELPAARQSAESALNLLAGSPTAYSMFQGYSGISEVYIHLWENSGDDTESRKNSGMALQSIKQFVSYARIFPIGKPMVYRFEGIYYWIANKHKKAINSWMRSLSAAERLEMPYEIGLAHFELGSHEFGKEIDQSKHLELAKLKFDQLGVRYG
jgi:tetratricopeptide (TPR) repeat protein